MAVVKEILADRKVHSKLTDLKETLKRNTGKGDPSILGLQNCDPTMPQPTVMNTRLMPAGRLLSEREVQIRNEAITEAICKGLPKRTRRGNFKHVISTDHELNIESKEEDDVLGDRKRNRRETNEGQVRMVGEMLDCAFEERRELSDQWPSAVEEATIRQSVQRFREWITGNSHATSCCTVCAQLVSPMSLKQVLEVSPELELLTRRQQQQQQQQQDDQYGEMLDQCRRNSDGSCNVCTSCLESLEKGNVPRLAMANGLCCGCSQDQPECLVGLTHMEEMVIARGRAFGSIIKLRPSGMNAAGYYRRMKGHVVVVPMQPQSLLNVLPCSENDLSDRIQVRWQAFLG